MLLMRGTRFWKDGQICLAGRTPLTTCRLGQDAGGSQMEWWMSAPGHRAARRQGSCGFRLRSPEVLS